MAGQPTQFGHSLDTLRLSDRDQDALLSELDAVAQGHLGPDNRTDPRYGLGSRRGLTVEMLHPGGTRAAYLIRPRNISRRGMSLLHGNFVHTGTECIANLETLDGELTRVDGCVVRCRHVRGSVHEIGVRFARQIDLTAFVPQQELGQDSEAFDRLPTFRGSILYVEEAVEDRDLLRMWLGDLGLQMTGVQTAEDALLYTEDIGFDAVFTGYWLSDLDGAELVRQLRTSGFEKPVLALTGDDSPEVADAFVKARADRVLTKPIDLPTLAETLSCFFEDQGAGATDGSRPIVSSRWSDTRLRPLIRAFVNHLPQTLATLEDALDGNDDNGWRRACMRLKGTAANYGFAPLSEAIGALISQRPQAQSADADRSVLKQVDAVAQAIQRGLAEPENQG